MAKRLLKEAQIAKLQAEVDGLKEKARNAKTAEQTLKLEAECLLAEVERDKLKGHLKRKAPRAKKKVDTPRSRILGL